MTGRRRSLLATGVSLVLLAGAGGSAAAAEQSPEDTPTKTPIKHFITLMQENHSFDNYFGTYPGANGIPDGVCMPVDPKDPDGECIRAHHIVAKSVEDLPHSAGIARAQFNDGAMDGFVSAVTAGGGEVDPNIMGHYDDTDLPFYWNVADNYTLFDRFFTATHGGSISNHMFWVTGQAGVASIGHEAIPEDGFKVKTIFDRLEAKGISWKFYVQNYDPTITFRTRVTGDRGSQIVWVPVLDIARFLDDPELNKHIVPMDQFYDDVAHNNLPAVSYIAPSGSSEHPPGSLKAGETFVRTMIGALMRSDSWSSSAFVWSYDDWGGWYDHVKPPAVDEFGYGFRAPALLVSPYSRQGYIEHKTYDFTSYLAFIEENWGLKPLASRDRKANSLGDAFDFAQAPRPPVLLNRERNVVAEPEPKAAPVYLGYGLALFVFAVITVMATLATSGPDSRIRRWRGK